ncbi:ABC transporter ATP-binding protein [Marinobacter salarius]|uniref:ABC transporter ATP-binding protein n=1 Tax=Marinobacter salarius TaxID=1420917 RepID=UPI0032EFD6D0
MTPKPVILKTRGLSKNFVVKPGFLGRAAQRLHAVSEVSLEVRKGETLGIVGESGCGKSTLGRLLVGLMKPTVGEVWISGKNISALPEASLRPLRKNFQMVFQDPYASLNPKMKAGNILAEPIRNFNPATRAVLERRIKELLDRVGLPSSAATRYPHEFSGGQRQRLSIARALALDPEIIVADEAVSALDVSVQAQVLNLLSDLQKDLGLTYVFIAHDLGVVEHISDEVAVMYLGRIVEKGPVKSIFSAPAHPYTELLLRSVPQMEPGRHRRALEEAGELPSPMNLPHGCAFAGRCGRVTKECRVMRPALTEIQERHFSACYHPVA